MSFFFYAVLLKLLSKYSYFNVLIHRTFLGTMPRVSSPIYEDFSLYKPFRACFFRLQIWDAHWKLQKHSANLTDIAIYMSAFAAICIFHTLFVGENLRGRLIYKYYDCQIQVYNVCLNCAFLSIVNFAEHDLFIFIVTPLNYLLWYITIL